MNTSNTFFGHPIGLRTLFLTEMWERMSYYGMRALLVLYMTGAVTGFNPGLGWSQVDAQAIYGIYVGMVYFMVVPGGWIADNILGHQKAVLIDKNILWFGSLNPLSFSGKTNETMMRILGEDINLTFANSVSVSRSGGKENPKILSIKEIKTISLIVN